ncbi:MAG: HNH endonuclease signature motif containing protein [Bdellovibrionota bacterium]
MNEFQSKLHEQALVVARTHREAEADLLDVLQKVEQHKVFIAVGCSSMFQYCVQILRLSENTAFNAITVARKSKEVPSLKQEVKAGRITLSSARRVTSVLTPKNQQKWLGLASRLPQRALEREIAKENPRTATREMATYVSEHRLELKLGVSEKLIADLRRVQDLLSQKRQKPVSLEQALEAMTALYLESNDPVKKADRILGRVGRQSDSVGKTPQVATENHKVPAQYEDQISTTQFGARRESRQVRTGAPMSFMTAPQRLAEAQPVRPNRRAAILAGVRHKVFRKTKGQCTYRDSKGNRCNEQRWLHFHHIKPVSEGGENVQENLTLLCRNHHVYLHRMGVI